MSCVEGAVVAQVPEPNQYWEHVKSQDRAYFIGRTPEGDMVWQIDGDTVEVGNLDWSDWRHIPGCTGWDWEPDQVEEYPQYYVGTSWVDGTAYVIRTTPKESHAVDKWGKEFWYAWDDSAKRFIERGTLIRVTEAEAMARLDKPAAEETYPQCWTTESSFYAYLQRDSKDSYRLVDRQGNKYTPAPWYPRDATGRTRLTEQEALALLDKHAKTFTVYYIHTDPSHKWYVRATTRESLPDVHLADGSVVRSQAHWDEIDSFVNAGVWLEVTEAEARARVAVPAEPRIEVQFLPVAPEMDWVVQDRVPARNNIDEWCWCRADRKPKTFQHGFAGWSSGIMHGHRMGDEVLHLRCRRKDLPVVESPEDWVELPGNHVLRPGIDQVAVHSPDNWVTFYESVTSWIPCACRCRRKDVPNIESPEDWVTQDRVEARPGIDQGWWSYAAPNVDKSKWSWWPIANSGSAIGRKHGHVHEDGQMLNLRCKRKDLPPIPAPVEETFPQWYILKESEWMPGVTLWAIKRTGDETCIRYAFDGGEELSAANETWYGGTDAWRKCNPAEAFERLGILVEEHLPAVPSDKRRVPVKLWVTYRLNDEGGDWPVRATQADQTCQNWKEIKFDGNGAFIEVEK